MTARTTASETVSRRRFVEWGLGLVAALFSLLLAIPLVGYFTAVLLRRTPEQWAQVCTLDQVNAVTPTLFRVTFPSENAPYGYEDVRGVFVIRKDDEILAFTNVCTHMSCSVRWLDWREQVLCPCHGGMYDRWGNLVGGPPAYSLPYYAKRIEGNVLYVANRLEYRE